MVYEYAITSESDYVTVVDGEIGYINLYSQVRSFNELQYVSKQLRAETVGLTLKLNKSVRFFSEDFTSNSDQTPKSLSDCLTFLAECTPTSISKLATLLIEFPEPPHVCYPVCALSWSDIGRPLSEFCAANPHVLVKLRLTNWALKHCEYEDFRIAARFSETGFVVRHFCDLGMLGTASNLRVVPSGSLPDEAVMSRCMPPVQVTEAKEWYDKGISGADRPSW
ncbi:uncharacterized protein BDZ99DRAFT_67693 [Mytilinidion resinicola]|uniref:Uncharacterized protein n=1 Tax=Mytilinidion resinicola TaxID=574789 RepID=A0A6A6YIW3_9PEZI|nr:uncharacterized protein BDZ99DRAFT_67693 [Mytilinidion resinicola]KAF2807867.1 hypothetical protein BDZ99DRAFT_67693 [Mytilinidion resinicola]